LGIPINETVASIETIVNARCGVETPWRTFDEAANAVDAHL
jgi:hypothetical protein